VQRSIVSILATLGGVLVVLGGILGFLLSLGPDMYGPRLGGPASGLILGALAVILGLVILVYSGFSHVRGSARGMTGGLVLVILGIVAWVVVGEWIVVAVGAFLTVAAGILLLFEVLVADSHRRLFPPW
jgi:hypothetical protein